MTSDKSTSNSGPEKLKRAINQARNARHLLLQLPQKYWRLYKEDEIKRISARLEEIAQELETLAQTKLDH